LLGRQGRARRFGRLTIAVVARRGRLFAAKAPAPLAPGRVAGRVLPIEGVLIVAQGGTQLVDLLLQRVQPPAERFQPGAQAVLERANGRQVVG